MADDFIPLEPEKKRKEKKDKKRKREEDGDGELKKSKKSKSDQVDDSAQQVKEKKPKKEKKAKKSKSSNSVSTSAPESNGAEATREPAAAEAQKVLQEVTRKKEKKQTKYDRERAKREAKREMRARMAQYEQERKAAEGIDTTVPDVATADGEGKKKSRKSKKSKKSSDKTTTEAIAANEPTAGQDEIPMPREPTQDELQELEQTANEGSKEVQEDALADGEDPAALDSKADTDAGNKKDRFIVFVGNLPFSVTKDALEKHFAKITPSAIRLQTDKKSGKPKGFAFVEFEHYDKMKTCLTLYHHTELEGRKINIELTAGGGGNSTFRKDKVQSKNEKLHDQRKRRVEEEQKEKKKQDAKAQKGKDSKKGKKAKTVGAGNPVGLDGTTDSFPEAAAADGSHAGIHPSRLARMGW